MNVRPGAGWGRRFLRFSCSRRGSTGWAGRCWGDWRGSFTGLKTVELHKSPSKYPTDTHGFSCDSILFRQQEKTPRVRNLFWDHFCCLKPPHKRSRTELPKRVSSNLVTPDTETSSPVNFTSPSKRLLPSNPVSFGMILILISSFHRQRN